MEDVKNIAEQKHNNLTIGDICPNCKKTITSEPKKAHVIPKFYLDFIKKKSTDNKPVVKDLSKDLPDKSGRFKGSSGQEFVSGKFWCADCEDTTHEIDTNMRLFFNDINIDMIKQNLLNTDEFKQFNFNLGIYHLNKDVDYQLQNQTIRKLNEKQVVNEFTVSVLQRDCLYHNKPIMPIDTDNIEIQMSLHSNKKWDHVTGTNVYHYDDYIVIPLPKGIDIFYRKHKNKKKEEALDCFLGVNGNNMSDYMLIQITDTVNVPYLLDCFLKTAIYKLNQNIDKYLKQINNFGK
jgi:hypothetical protein